MSASYQARPSLPGRTAAGGQRERERHDGDATGREHSPAGDSSARTVGRRLHPWAWWVWALGTAAAVSLTTNPLLVLLVAAAVVVVTLVKRSDDVWARSIAAYLYLAAAIIVIRVFFQIVVGADRPGGVLFTLPEIPLPEWAAGIRLGGPVRTEFLIITVYDALRLGTMLLCVGAANALANPRRALRSVPSALYEVSVAVVIALTVAPQLVVSAVQARRARRLRGGGAKGLRAVRAVLIPVLENAVEQSMALAAGMESRGFGRTRTGRGRWLVTVLVLAAASLIAYGVFMVLGSPGGLMTVPYLPLWTGQLALPLGIALAVVAFWWSGRRIRTTRYRPDPWRAPETLVCAAALAALAVMMWLSGSFEAVGLDTPLRQAWLIPPVEPLAFPQLHPLMMIVPTLVVLPVLLAPRPPASVRRQSREQDAAPHAPTTQESS